jgi:hypothetical protein
MAVGKKEKIVHALEDFPKYKILDEIKERAKKEVDLFAVPENDPDPVQKRRDLKNWKKSMGYYMLHPKKFKFSSKDLK